MKEPQSRGAFWSSCIRGPILILSYVSSSASSSVWRPDPQDGLRASWSTMSAVALGHIWQTSLTLTIKEEFCSSHLTNYRQTLRSEEHPHSMGWVGWMLLPSCASVTTAWEASNWLLYFETILEEECGQCHVSSVVATWWKRGGASASRDNRVSLSI